jgi:hypothetical protein
MSLTSFIKDKAILLHILTEWPKPDFDLQAEIKAPPLTKNYALVGTAFDYLFRFYLKKIYPSAIEEPWVSEIAVKGPVFKLTEGKALDSPEVLSGIIALKNVKDGRTEYAKYLKSGKISTELLEAVIHLARVDAIYRAKYIDPRMGTADNGDVEDLRKLYEIIPLKIFEGKNRILLNPNFGEASHLVGGADGDIILDGQLIDIKTTKYLELRPDYWAQLVGYATLADLSLKKTALEITSVGIYYSRHGVMWNYPIQQLYSNKKYPNFKKWFKEQAERVFGSSGLL